MSRYARRTKNGRVLVDCRDCGTNVTSWPVGGIERPEDMDAHDIYHRQSDRNPAIRRPANSERGE